MKNWIPCTVEVKVHSFHITCNLLKDWPEKAVVVDDLEEKKMKEKHVNEEDDDQPSTASLIKSNLPGPDSTCLGMVKGNYTCTYIIFMEMFLLKAIVY